MVTHQRHFAGIRFIQCAVIKDEHSALACHAPFDFGPQAPAIRRKALQQSRVSVMRHNPFSLRMRGGCFHPTEHFLGSYQKVNVVLLVAFGLVHTDCFTHSPQLRNVYQGKKNYNEYLCDTYAQHQCRRQK